MIILGAHISAMAIKSPTNSQRRNRCIDWRAAFARLEGAYADSTLRAYRADMHAFERWCAIVGKCTLPATPETVAAFIAYEAETSSAATLKRRLAAIRKVHRLLRMDNPVTDEEVVIESWHREFGL